MTGQSQADRHPPDLERIDKALIHLRRFFDHQPGDEPEPGVEMSTLLVLEVVTREGKPATVSDVAERLGVTPSTASRLVARAERAGMVTRTAAPSDKRAAIIQPTVHGTRLRERSIDFRIAHLAALTDAWTAAETATFARLLERFAHHAGPPSPDHPPDETT
jgi:DNA-binding MarR family transcriptional regulator